MSAASRARRGSVTDSTGDGGSALGRTAPTAVVASGAERRRGVEPLARERVAETVGALGCSWQALDRVADWGRRLSALLSDGSRLMIAGNGGSAAEAQHLSAEFLGRFRTDRDPFPALALTTDTAALTAICNDYGPNELFARQVQAHGRPGDVLMLISTSGHSPNLLEAARRARLAGVTTWALTGPGPNPLAEHCHEAATVQGPSVAAIQEVQLVAVHLLCAAFDQALGVGEPASEQTA